MLHQEEAVLHANMLQIGLVAITEEERHSVEAETSSLLSRAPSSPRTLMLWENKILSSDSPIRANVSRREPCKVPARKLNGIRYSLSLTSAPQPAISDLKQLMRILSLMTGSVQLIACLIVTYLRTQVDHRRESWHSATRAVRKLANLSSLLYIMEQALSMKMTLINTKELCMKHDTIINLLMNVGISAMITGKYNITIIFILTSSIYNYRHHGRLNSSRVHHHHSPRVIRDDHHHQSPRVIRADDHHHHHSPVVHHR